MTSRISIRVRTPNTVLNSPVQKTTLRIAGRNARVSNLASFHVSGGEKHPIAITTESGDPPPIPATIDQTHPALVYQDLGGGYFRSYLGRP